VKALRQKMRQGRRSPAYNFCACPIRCSDDGEAITDLQHPRLWKTIEEYGVYERALEFGTIGPIPRIFLDGLLFGKMTTPSGFRITFMIRPPNSTL
jgi:hypothetical protein